MNYGDQSELTSDDKNDLRTLYHLAWNGKLTHVNGTPIKFVTPFHSNANNSWIAMEIPDQRQ
ncbi:hypothetical protein CLV98_10311 [Dyadobacter jejuensis]|uniref:Uncharacterized protein n=1 Tax=Dyadobacter jejuensis TaxID=1082580 RepID=A0A316AM45_9BACT|nr:hypothetical protein [Dyadobacter jejuensis]PWJ58646.1 hypothetical protein CLV98_10311 [Dyadobacter jejuensis]